MVTCRSKRSSLAHSCARNTSTSPHPTTSTTSAPTSPTLTRSTPVSKMAARVVLSLTPPSRFCKAYSLPLRRTLSYSRMRPRSLPHSGDINMFLVSAIYDMYQVVSLTPLQLRLSSLPMIARLRAGRTAQYSQLLLCGTISDMNLPDVRGACENVLRFT